MTVLIGLGGEPKAVTDVWIGVAGDAKPVVEGFVGTADGNRRFLAPAPETPPEDPPAPLIVYMGSSGWSGQAYDWSAEVGFAIEGGVPPYDLIGWSDPGSADLDLDAETGVIFVHSDAPFPPIDYFISIAVRDSAGQEAESEPIVVGGGS